MVIEFVPAQFVGGKSFEKRDCGQHVAVASHRNARGAEAPGKQPLRRGFGETPTVASLVRLVRAEAADAGQRYQQCTAGFENAVQSGDRAVQIEDVMQRLRQDDAVEPCVRDVGRARKVGNDGGARKSGLDVEHVLVRDTAPAEAA
jgi:hypothetical protein